MTVTLDTIASFRRQHLKQFKALFRTTVAACVEAGMVSMNHVAVDGSRVEANNGRGQTKTAEDLEQMLASIDARIEKIVAEAEAKDAQEDTLFGKENTPNDLPRELRDLKTRQAKLEQACEKIQAKMARAMEVDGTSAEAAAKKRVPVTDPDSDVMKNKTGGFGPSLAGRGTATGTTRGWLDGQRHRLAANSEGNVRQIGVSL